MRKQQEVVSSGKNININGNGNGNYNTKVRKGLWSPEEDDKLINYMLTNGQGCWSDVARNAGLQRCGKSCRLRWINYLRPDLKRGAFSPQEEQLIIHLHSLLGNRWSQIATRLPGRTDNEIKNFWNSTLKKRFKNSSFSTPSPNKSDSSMEPRDLKLQGSSMLMHNQNMIKSALYMDYCSSSSMALSTMIDPLLTPSPSHSRGSTGSGAYYTNPERGQHLSMLDPLPTQSTCFSRGLTGPFVHDSCPERGQPPLHMLANNFNISRPNECFNAQSCMTQVGMSSCKYYNEELIMPPTLENLNFGGSSKVENIVDRNTSNISNNNGNSQQQMEGLGSYWETDEIRLGEWDMEELMKNASFNFCQN